MAFRVTRETKGLLDAAAARRGVSVSEFCRAVVEDSLDAEYKRAA